MRQPRCRRSFASPRIIAHHAAIGTCQTSEAHWNAPLRSIEPHLDNADDAEDETTLVELGLLLQAAILVEHRDAVRALSARLASVAHLATGDWVYTCPARHLGDAALLVGDRAAARAYYAQALDTAGKISFRPEVAATRVSLAEVLLHEADVAARSEALEHINIAIPELRGMKMQPALERALALKARLEASS